MPTHTITTMPRHIAPDEQAIARKLVATLLSHSGVTISVRDECEWTVRRSTNAAEILGLLGHDGMNTLVARDANRESLGSFLLIWGNGPDLISDCSANDFCETICSEVCPNLI